MGSAILASSKTEGHGRTPCPQVSSVPQHQPRVQGNSGCEMAVGGTADVLPVYETGEGH